MPAQPRLDTVLGKVIAILESFGPADQAVPLSEVVRRTGLPKSTVHRLLNDLVETRLVERDAQNRHRLGGRLFELGMRASLERQMLEVAVPFLQDLYERTHQTVHLGVLEGLDVVYVSKIGGHRPAASPSRVGGRMPLHCTAIGKAMLAHAGDDLLAALLERGLERRTPRTIIAPGLLARELERVRETGVAFEYEESTVGLTCVAAPVLDPTQTRPVAGVSVTGPVTRFRPEAHAAAVRAAAAGIAATLARRVDLR